MPIEFELSPEIQADVDELVATEAYAEFDNLRLHEVKIGACTKIKIGDDDMELKPTPGPAVKLTKVSDLMGVFTDSKYLVCVCAYFWQHAPVSERQSALHKALMGIDVVQKGDAVRYKTRRPDVNEFSATLTRFGPTPAVARLLDIYRAAAEETAALVRSGRDALAS